MSCGKSRWLAPTTEPRQYSRKTIYWNERAEFPYEIWLENKDGGRGRAYASPHPASWEEDLDKARLLVSCSDDSKTLLTKMNKDVVDFAPWVFLINFNDLYGVSDEIEWRPWATEIRMLYEVDLR